MDYFLFFIFGICIGSFCNVLIYRMPKGLSVVFPASHCLSCKHELKWFHNIPIFSWIFLGAKCAFCKKKISFTYPLVEFFSGILALLALYLEPNLLNASLLGLCLIVLFTLSIIDIKIKAVPEILLLVAYFLALLSTYENGFLLKYFSVGNLYGSPFLNSLIFTGAIVMVKSITSAWINRKNTNVILESMGDADTIIIAIIGALLGAQIGLFAIFLAAVLQLILHFFLRHKDAEAPFIPALSLALLISLICKDEILNLIKLYFKYLGI